MKLRDFAGLSARLQMFPILESGEETLVGGQAVMEGVMMRAPHSYCVAVRKPDGTIVTEESPLARPSERYPIFKYPVLRGLGTLGQAMWLGIRALRFSANAALEEVTPESKSKEIPGWVMGLNLAFSFVLFVVLYKFIPLWLTERLKDAFPSIQGQILFNLVDGILRILIFLAFLILISRWKEIRRVFEYHGAEHRVVFNFESGRPVTVENARSFPTFHPRCGTSFLLVVMMISIVLYMLLPVTGFAARFAIRILLLPLVVGLSYEMIRYAAKRRGSLAALLTAPGLWLQRITTQPPTDEQTQVAIRALEGAMALEERQGGRLVIA